MSALLGFIGVFGFGITLIVLIIKVIKRKSLKKTALVLAGCVVCFVVALLIYTPSPQIEEGIAANKSPLGETTMNEPSVEKDESFFEQKTEISELPTQIDTTMITTLMSKGYDVEQASAIQKILNTIGVTAINIQHMSGKASTGLNAVVCYPNGLTEENRRFYFTTDNGVLFYAGFLNDDLYDSEKGGYLKSYQDVHVPETEVDFDTYSELQIRAAEAIESYLTVPSSMNIHDFSWAVGRSDDKYQIIGSLSSQNAFGVKKDMSFTVWFVDNKGNFEVEGIAIDGKRVR